MIEVRLVGGHLDGGTMALPADAEGRPPAEIVCAAWLPAPARWTAEELEEVDRVATRYQRARAVPGPGWVMVAQGHRPPGAPKPAGS